jgi:autotransporter-associated beta strand protein
VNASSLATLDLNGQTVLNAITVYGTGISGNSNLIGALANTNTLTAATVSAAVTLGANSALGDGGNFTINGVVSGAYTLTKVGAGSLTLTNNSNTYSATTLMAPVSSAGAGTLIATVANALGNTTAISIPTSATLDLQNIT